MPQEVGQYNYIFASAVMGGVYGGIISLCQWLVLRKYIRNSHWWVLVGVVCNIMGITLNSIAFTVISYKVANLSNFDLRVEISIFILTVITALMAGFLEWLILRNIFLKSTWWIGIRIIANVTALMSIYFIKININGVGSHISDTLRGLICGVLIGIFSGFALSLFPNKNHQALAE